MGKSTPLKVALLGCGVVGSQVARQLLEQADDLRARVGRPLDLVGIAVRRLNVERPGIDSALLTDDAIGLASRPDVDLVIELMGGIEPARTLILAAINAGSSVITANKALLAEDGPTIYSAAEEAGVDVYFEAAVAGAIPIVRPLRESLVGDEVTAVMGIVNGTTNFILDKMHTDGADFDDVLAEAQRLGYAESDPTADVEGFDAAAKAAILASLAFHSRVKLSEVSREGITGVKSADIQAAKEMGCVIKLLARCALSEDGTIAVGVHPTMVPVAHPLASIPGAYNAIFIESRNAGRLMFMGKGAGGSPTASAVLGDLVTAARNRVRGSRGPGESIYSGRAITAAGEVRSRYYASMTVHDEPGVLAQVATAFARHGVSLQAVRQESTGEQARLGVMTHLALHREVDGAIADLNSMPEVHPGISLMRVEGA
ncbi:homoserine dehydrogenase [Propionicimonas sp.]|uniref:homoserine dehydrogenase n=1 Tax=Propionicimonas sp. TaxID=1955623 RepID=UPI00178EBA69|nr:homoserine dehydrogenase [Propionicimonas sp.]MBU3977474.1 homoserine dehydrogenase [Actinomycetota bacterium]MBA3021398.1 homoserine dehydrogenase [Propionicimonas sp.]MBU3985984.1 homoserine dehydrogenase [Actinomycetota bacterium]MBU4008769.1 homoserine dehydrogenase [Actinomycetota bacterium]MBU4066081.1 homoserine dehydrogenase [Actinomycetota bacterium]